MVWDDVTRSEGDTAHASRIFISMMIDPGRFWYGTALDKLQSKIHTLASTTSTPHGVLMNQEESRSDVPPISHQVLRC